MVIFFNILDNIAQSQNIIIFIHNSLSLFPCFFIIIVNTAYCVTVTLKRTLAGEVGTADMATWMLWAEVEKGLDYSWNLKDAGQSLPNVKY